MELVHSIIDAGMQSKSIFGNVQTAESTATLNVHLPTPAIQMGTWRNFDYAFLFSLKARLRGCVEYGYSILGPVSKRTFVKWCFLSESRQTCLGIARAALAVRACLGRRHARTC